MTELDRVGNNQWTIATLISKGFHRFCKSTKSARRQHEKKMECLHSDGSASYLLQNFGC